MRNFAQSLRELAPERRWSKMIRRTEHGGTAFESVSNHKQPQDGETRSERIADTALRTKLSPLGSLISEPADARLTGGTRSLMRRALGLNFRAVKPHKVASTAIVLKRPIAA